MTLTRTKNFSVDEITFSQTASRYNIDNSIPKELESNAQVLLNGLQKIRDLSVWKGAAVWVTSGYRCPRLNQIIPGSSTKSDHMLAYAADIKVIGFTPYEVSVILSKLMKDLGISQLIYEFNSWTHISFNPVDYGSNRILTIGSHTGKKYVPGIIKE